MYINNTMLGKFGDSNSGVYAPTWLIFAREYTPRSLDPSVSHERLEHMCVAICARVALGGGEIGSTHTSRIARMQAPCFAFGEGQNWG